MSRFTRLVLLGLAITAVSVVALPASAGPNTTVCTGFFSNTTFVNLDVPVGAHCVLEYPHVTGNVTVEGLLDSSNARFDRNVAVTGGTIVVANWGVIGGNLTITGSRGSNILNGAFNTIGGNVTYSGNVGGDGFYLNNGDVAGNVTASFNTDPYDIIIFNTAADGNIAVNSNTTGGGPIWLLNNSAGKNLECLGNVPAPIGSGNSATWSKLGQCSGL